MGNNYKKNCRGLVVTNSTDKSFSGELESLRGIAATIVVFYHSPFVSGEKWKLIQAGDLFVDFFFVLSGFVMTLAYSIKVRDGMDFNRFAALRFFRIYPLHLALLIVWVVYVFAKSRASDFLDVPFVWADEIGLLAFLMNLLLLQGMGVLDTLSWNAPAWSISVEFFAYVAFFIFFKVVRSQATLAALIVSVASYAVIVFVPGEKSADDLLVTYDYGFLRCLGGFFFGVFVQLVSRSYAPIKLTPVVASILQVFLVCITFWAVIMSHGSFRIELFCVVLFGALITFFAQTDGVVTHILNASPLRFLGKISYSIYLVHAIILTVALNVAEYLLKWEVTFVDETENKVVQTTLAAPINAALFLGVVVFSYFTWASIEVWGQKLGKKLLYKYN